MRENYAWLKRVNLKKCKNFAMIWSLSIIAVSINSVHVIKTESKIFHNDNENVYWKNHFKIKHPINKKIVNWLCHRIWILKNYCRHWMNDFMTLFLITFKNIRNIFSCQKITNILANNTQDLIMWQSDPSQWFSCSVSS